MAPPGNEGSKPEAKTTSPPKETAKVRKLAYGLPDRLCLKIVQQQRRPSTQSSIKTSTKYRNKEDSIKASWTPRQPKSSEVNETPRLLQLPKLKTSAFVAAQQDREQRFGYFAALNKGAARCAHTAYGSRVHDASQMAAALKWEQIESKHSPRKEKGSAPLSPYLTSFISRSSNITNVVPSSAPATAPSGNGSSPSAVWDIIHLQAPFRATSSRFAARTAAEERRIATPDLIPVQNKARLEYHAARGASRELKIKALQALAENWPHGLPTARRLSAEKKDLGGSLGGLGYGNSAQSMPEAQYNAVKATLKLP